MTWAEVAARLAGARTYWLGTVTPSGAPHTVYLGALGALTSLFLLSDGRPPKSMRAVFWVLVTCSLFAFIDVLIVHGTVADLGVPADVPDVVTALSAKYTWPEDQQFLPASDPDFDVVWAVRPRSALAWRLVDYDGSQRRWTAG